VELATYCGAHAVNSLYNRYSQPMPNVGTAMLMTSCALLLHSWSKHPNRILNLLFFGEEERSELAIERK
jgi:hypothetical protein